MIIISIDKIKSQINSNDLPLYLRRFKWKRKKGDGGHVLSAQVLRRGRGMGDKTLGP